MKTFLKSFVAGTLAILARSIIRKYRPTIVMITGSVGKTSTKDAVAAALGNRYFVRKSDKSYNSEFGVPLTIFGIKNPWSNAFAWVRVIGEALALIYLPSHYPKMLVLEVGADRPGDLEKILRIATPDAVVVTRLPEVPVHVEAYANPEAVREEEFAPAYALAPGAPLVLSSDDPYALTMAAHLPTRVVTFGYADDSEVKMRQAKVLMEEGKVCGMEAMAEIDGKSYALAVRGALGREQLYAPAAALALSLALGLTPEEALLGLQNYLPPPGRARLLRGRKNTLLVDDSYNASPAAVEGALASLRLIPNTPRRMGVLGDMLELGRYSFAEHERIGKLASTSLDVLMTVGPRARSIGEAAKAAGMKEERVFMFETSQQAAPHVREMLQEGDTVLVKGSQSIRMERILERLLAHSNDLTQLVRQEKEWKRR